MGLRGVVAALLMLLALLVVGLAVSALVVAQSLPQDQGLEGSGWELVAVCALLAGGLVAVGLAVLRSASSRADEAGFDTDGTGG